MKLPRLILTPLIALAPVLAAATELAEVHVFSTGENGIFANAYLIETSAHVVAIDATLLESTSQALREKLVAIGKPLRAVLLTHGHPDHYNGVTRLVAGEKVEVIATAATDRVIREYDAAKEAQWAPVFGTEWPKQRTFPNRVFADGESLAVDGVTFSVHPVGPGESHADSYWLMTAGSQRVAFIGDIVLQGVHAYVSDGHTTAWLKNLARVRAELKPGDRIYPGHGDAGGLELFDAQRDYLLEYRRVVASLAEGKPNLTDEQKKALTAQMLSFRPTHHLEFLIALGADAVAGELVKERK
ncbi:MAG TPA: MBL fold metallo-hydrolase [Candidatus Didemnitutus sp.]|nr:MBL fold metallo-hydrolase [Candidatus Didemnitutus sp.]